MGIKVDHFAEGAAPGTQNGRSDVLLLCQAAAVAARPSHFGMNACSQSAETVARSLCLYFIAVAADNAECGGQAALASSVAVSGMSDEIWPSPDQRTPRIAHSSPWTVFARSPIAVASLAANCHSSLDLGLRTPLPAYCFSQTSLGSNVFPPDSLSQGYCFACRRERRPASEGWHS